MSRTVYYTAASLDGFIATADHDLEWLLSRTAGELGELDYPRFLSGVGALCMGANTYRWLHRQSLQDSGEPGVWPYQQPCWVFAHTAVPAWPGANIEVVSGSVASIHPQLRDAAGDADVWIVGGGELAGQFHDHGLLDEIVVSIAPVTLGAGRPLLPRRTDLRCLAVHRSGDFVATRFEVLG